MHRFNAADNHRRYCHREAFRVTRGALEVRELSVREALAECTGIARMMARYVFLRQRP